MFEPGELIIYGSSGVCRVEEVGRPLGGAADPNRLYYTLTPVYGSGVIYTPVDTKVFMRPVITREEALSLIGKIPEIEQTEYDNRDYKVLADQYRAALKTHNCEELVQLIKTIYLKKRAMMENGKKPGITDEQYMKRAEDLLHEELAVVLDIPLDSVPSYIEQIVSKEERSVIL